MLRRGPQLPRPRLASLPPRPARLKIDMRLISRGAAQDPLLCAVDVFPVLHFQTPSDETKTMEAMAPHRRAARHRLSEHRCTVKALSWSCTLPRARSVTFVMPGRTCE